MKGMPNLRIVAIALLFSMLLMALSTSQFAGAKTSRARLTKDVVNCFATANIPSPTGEGVTGVGNIQCFGGVAKRIDVRVTLNADGAPVNAAINGGLNTNFASAVTSSKTHCGTGVSHTYATIVSGTWQDDNGIHSVTPIVGAPAFLVC